MTEPRTQHDAILRFYDALHAHYGPTHWWPGETPFEIAVGAILTQNTAWTNVERAIDNLKAADALDPRALLARSDEELHELLRPAGFFRVKTKRLLHFCRHLVDRYDGDMARLAARPMPALRRELLALHGIGPETADDILLYACDKPVFVIDAYTRRIFSRHGLCPRDIDYHALQALFEAHLPRDLRIYGEYHGLIVFAGKDFCRRTPKCDACPLGPLLDPGQPVLS